MTNAISLLARLALLAACGAAAAVPAAPVYNNMRIQRLPLGSGQQGAEGTETAQPVADFGVWHAPQYMPGYPTSATIWPRAVAVPCSGDVCAGYQVTPELGRGEYLFFVPAQK